MRSNRIADALRALGGAGTAQDIAGIARARPECVSAQLSGMERRGQVRKVGQRRVCVRRWNGSIFVTASIWSLHV